MSICRWCYEKEAATFDGLCQECADAIRKEKKETERFDLDKRLEEDKITNDKEIETTQKEVLQSLTDAGIELTPSNTTLGKQLQKLLQKEDEYCALYMLVDELYAREKSNNSVHQDLHGTSWVDLIDMAINLLQKIKNHE